MFRRTIGLVFPVVAIVSQLPPGIFDSARSFLPLGSTLPPDIARSFLPPVSALLADSTRTTFVEAAGLAALPEVDDMVQELTAANP